MYVNENTLTNSHLSDHSSATIHLSGQDALPLLRRNSSKIVAARVGDWRKRGLDIIIASAALLLLMPLMLMIAALVKIHSPGPAIYGHQRVGLGGKPFKCWKFRTMVSNGDEVLQRHIMSSEAGAPGVGGHTKAQERPARDRRRRRAAQHEHG